MSRWAQYFPDIAIRLLNVFITKIQCLPIVLQVIKRIGHCVLVLWSIRDKVKLNYTWLDESYSAGLREGCWLVRGVGMVLKPGFQPVAAAAGLEVTSSRLPEGNPIISSSLYSITSLFTYKVGPPIESFVYNDNNWSVFFFLVVLFVLIMLHKSLTCAQLWIR